MGHHPLQFVTLDYQRRACNCISASATANPSRGSDQQSCRDEHAHADTGAREVTAAVGACRVELLSRAAATASCLPITLSILYLSRPCC